MAEPMNKTPKRIVVKVGTSILTRSASQQKDKPFEIRTDSALACLVQQIATLKSKGIEVLLVTSGAIGAGMKQLQWVRGQADLAQKQAAAAMGQVALMQSYEKLFKNHAVSIAQILLTRSDFEDRKRYLNARNTLRTLLDFGIVPIINENDTVSTEEIQFGDNDYLSALVAVKTDADLLVMLTDVDGLFQFTKGRTKALVPRVPKITSEIEKMAWKTSHNAVGTGGMRSKIQAAKIATASGITTIIANAYTPGILEDILAGKEVGTQFLAVQSLKSKERWILFGATPQGELTVDAGAEKALKQLRKSLLPAGIVSVQGFFKKGDVIKIKSEQGLELARGIVSFSAEQVKKIMGYKSSEVASLLGLKSTATEVVHRNALVLIQTH
jgi:glutamate 5-kinase